MNERRSPFRSSLVVEPLAKRLALAAIPVAVYALAFTPLYRQGGTGVLGLALFPVVVLAWLFGVWGGLLAGVLSVPVNALLLNLVGEPGWAVVVRTAGGEGSALVLAIGCVIGLLRDLGVRLDRSFTEWRRAERALRETEDRYRILFQRSRDPMFITTPEGRFLEANDALLRIFGYGRAEILDLGTADLHVDPQDRVHFREQVMRNGWVEDFPVQLRTRAGDVRDCLITSTVRRGEDGAVVEYQGSIRDVSESSALLELTERRTRELQSAVAELEAFTYSVSHDLRTHLVTLGGFISILWAEHRDELSPKAREFLQRIQAASRRMDTFIQDLLTYGRVGRAEVKLEAVSLAQVVETAKGALAGPILERKAQVVVETELPLVEADRMLLDRVVENLLSNAVKFVPEQRTPEVRLRARVQDRHVRFEVQDNGVGIASEDVARSFRAFERLDPVRFPGTGVGLSIVQKALERMGGDVGVTSTPGEGSTFWVLLRSGPPPEPEP
ncbi:MAG: PAS domain S-box protein [Gemmatimonadetes bacterium]|nr:PAS domain S-box protein [Gemmatimonadota bacterium]